MSSQYKVRVVENEFLGFNKARFQISVGQAYHEGEKFGAAARWAAENFEQVSVNLCDSLQRHNYVFLGFTPFDAFDRAIAVGDAWIERNKQYLNILPSLTITRWEDWKKKEEWAQSLARTNDLYMNDLIFKKIIHDSSEEFWLRRQEKENYHFSKKENFITASQRYLLEEVAVSMVMSKHDITEVYPGTFPKPLYYMRESNIPAPNSMTSIRFMRSSQKNAA